MRINWECVSVTARPDGLVVALVDFTRSDEGVTRREELLLDPADPRPLAVQLRKKAEDRATGTVAVSKASTLDTLAATAGVVDIPDAPLGVV